MKNSRYAGIGRLALIAVLSTGLGSIAQAQQPSGEVVIASSQMRQQFDPTAMVAMPDYLAFEGVSLLNEGLAAVSREEMLAEAEAGRANPGEAPE